MFLLPQNFSLWFRNRNFFTWRNIFIKKTREKIFLEINEKYFQSLSGGISRNMGFYFGTARRSSLNFRFYLKITKYYISSVPFRIMMNDDEKTLQDVTSFRLILKFLPWLTLLRTRI